jgi:hypothetical protein
MTVPAVDTFTAHRFNVRVADLSDFQQRYEQAVPLYPVKEVDAMVEREAPGPKARGTAGGPRCRSARRAALINRLCRRPHGHLDQLPGWGSAAVRPGARRLDADVQRRAHPKRAGGVAARCKSSRVPRS